MFLPFFRHHANLLGQCNIAQLPILLKQYYPEQQGLPAHAINKLYVAWLLRDLQNKTYYRSNNTLEQLQNPIFRQQYIGPCPTGLTDFLHIYDKLADDKLYWQDVPLSSVQQQQILELQQQHPILSSDIFYDLAWRQQMGSLCTVVILQQGKTYHWVKENDALWQYSVENAAIMMWQAHQQTSHRLRAWLAALLHGVALAAIRKLVEELGHGHNSQQLLQDAIHYQYRLTYWIAKDWGLPDDILFSLRQRFMCDKAFSDNTLMMQSAEHIAFIRDLRQHQQFSKRHCVQMLLSLRSDVVKQHLDSLL